MPKKPQKAFTNKKAPRRPRKNAPPVPAKTSEPERPKWLTETLDEPDYKLEVMCGCGDCNSERVDLTREEFIMLKEHLFRMRCRGSKGPPKTVKIRA
jgi:hypothetical protein